jgi:hypothetical protein
MRGVRGVVPVLASVLAADTPAVSELITRTFSPCCFESMADASTQ